MAPHRHKRRVYAYTIIAIALCGEAVCLYWLGVRHDWAAAILIVAGWAKHGAAKVFEEVVKL